MSMFSAFDVTASGLTAQRLRMDVISENVANFPAPDNRRFAAILMLLCGLRKNH